MTRTALYGTAKSTGCPYLTLFSILSFWSEMLEMLLCFVSHTPHSHFQAFLLLPLSKPQILWSTHHWLHYPQPVPVALTSLPPMFSPLHCVLTSWPFLCPRQSPCRIMVKGRESGIRLSWSTAWFYHLLPVLCLLNYEKDVKIVPTL